MMTLTKWQIVLAISDVVVLSAPMTIPKIDCGFIVAKLAYMQRFLTYLPCLMNAQNT